MRVNIAKWGNSLAVRIPSPVARELHVGEGASLDMAVIDGALTMRPAIESDKSLDDLLDGITPQNLHGEVKTGEAHGPEFA